MNLSSIKEPMRAPIFLAIESVKGDNFFSFLKKLLPKKLFVL